MVCFICDIKTHISRKQFGQMLIYLGHEEYLGPDEAICNAKYGIIFFLVNMCMFQKILEMIKKIHGEKAMIIQQWISKG